MARARKPNTRKKLTARQQAQRRKEAARKAARTRLAKSLGLTVTELNELTGYEAAQRFHFQEYMKREARKNQQPKRGIAPDFDEYESEEPSFEPPPEPEDFDEFEEDQSDFEPDWSSMSKADLVVAMLNMMGDEIGKKNLRKLLSEIPSDEYPDLASRLWNMPEAERNGYVIRYHENVVNQRRAAEQEFMKSEEFAEEVGGFVDPKSWM